MDSQLIALPVEEIFEPERLDSIETFIPFYFIRANAISTDEIKSAYGTGLHQRFTKVIGLVPEESLQAPI